MKKRARALVSRRHMHSRCERPTLLLMWTTSRSNQYQRSPYMCTVSVRRLLLMKSGNDKKKKKMVMPQVNNKDDAIAIWARLWLEFLPPEVPQQHNSAYRP